MERNGVRTTIGTSGTIIRCVPQTFYISYPRPLQPTIAPRESKARAMQMQMNAMLNAVNGRGHNRTTPDPSAHNTHPVPHPEMIIGGRPGLQYFRQSPHPIYMMCPQCKHWIHTHVRLLAGSDCTADRLFFRIGCFWCVNDQDVEHSCPKCGRFLGIYKPSLE